MAECDQDVLDRIFQTLNARVAEDAYSANAYDEDGRHAAGLAGLPVGLRAMAATHHLDISLTLDDIGWHFLNFGEPSLVRETIAGLKELGLTELVGYFEEAAEIMSDLQGQINGDNYRDCLQEHEKSERIDKLNRTAWAIDKSGSVVEGAIHSAWIRYAREHPIRCSAKGYR